MAHFWQHTLPMLSPCLFEEIPAEVRLVHLNVCNLKTKTEDIRVADIMNRANILLLNETHLIDDDHLSVGMLMLPDDMLIVRSDSNNFGCAVAQLIGNNLHPQKLTINSACEMAAATIYHPFEQVILSVYSSPTTPVADFTVAEVENNFTV